MNFNTIILAGNLIRDPALKYTAEGKAFCRFSIGVNPDKGAPSSSKPLFIQIMVWGKKAEACNEWLKKGQNVIVQGALQQRVWQTAEGMQVILQVFAHRVEFGPTPKPKEGVAAVLAEGTKPTEQAPEDDGAVPPVEGQPDEDDPGADTEVPF